MAGRKSQSGDGLIVTVDGAMLAKAVTAVMGAAARKDTVPILTHVKIEVGEASVTLTASNLDQEASVQVEADVKARGQLCVDACSLGGLISKMKGLVTMTQEGSALQLVTGRYKASLPFLPAEDFPPFSRADGVDFDVASGVLVSGFGSVAHCMSADEARYYINGVYLERSGGDLIFTATDGHRLATIEVTAGDGPGFEPVIVPRHAVQDIIKMCERADGPVNVTVSDRRFEVAAKGECYRTKLIEGTYPDWRRVYPKADGTDIPVSRKELIEALELVVSASREKSTSVKFECEHERMLVTVGAGEGPRAAGIVEGADIPPCGPFGMNGKYVLAALERLSTDTVTMIVLDAMGPVCFETGDALRQLVMPLRV